MSDIIAQIATRDMLVEFDRRYGTIRSIKHRNCPFGTNFLGNEQNSRGIDPARSAQTGDVVSAVWEVETSREAVSELASFLLRPTGKWHRELTGRSAVLRQTSLHDGVFTVTFEGQSANEDGIRSYSLRMQYRPADDGSLLWDIEMENTCGHLLEIGELGFPLLANNDYAGLYGRYCL